MQINHRDLFAPSFFGVWNDLLARKYPEIWLAGGRGCVDGDTLVNTPTGNVKIRDFKGGMVYAYEDGRIVTAIADSPTRYTVERLFHVETWGGRGIVVTDEHKFLTSSMEWKMLKDIEVGESVIVYDEKTKRTVADKVSSIEFVKEDYYYDFNVNRTHNYVANGFVNHNSTKSSFISTAIILLMEMNPSWHCVCFRKYGSNLADSVFSQFEFTIKEKLTPLSDHWEFRKSPLKIFNVNTGQQILFRGLDDPLKMKSLKPPFGSYSLLWFEELAEFDGIEEIRSVGQSVKRGGHYFQTFCSYNPPETTASWVNYEAQKPQMVDGKEYRHVYHSNYLSVPVQWLGPQFFKEAEILRAENPRAYAHEYLGMVTGNGGAVFPNVRDYRMSDAMIRNFANIRIGCDFGFTLDPSAVTFMNIDMKRRNLFIFDEIYEQGLMNWTLANEIKKRECVGFNYIMCDSAEPKSIAEIESLGINALPTPKGPDSIRFGIKFLQSLKNIFIDKLRAPETFREFTQYEYEKTKSGQFISRFPDHDNHSIDSVRYGVHEDAVDAGFM